MSEVSAKPQSENPGCEKEFNTDKSCETAEDSGDKDEMAQPVANDVQRAIEGLKDMPDDELHEFLNDEDFIKDLDVVDAWEGDKEKEQTDRKSSRTRERDHTKISRERPRKDRKSPHNRERPKREDRRREDARRDPSKSSKDIERDKIRTKKDTDSKILAEKEKAIKHLLDSDTVVPPGTEVEAIQDITEKQQTTERGQQPRARRSRERRRSQERQRASPVRRRSNDRIRLSPHRRISDERRQIRISPEYRRNAASPNLRRSWERRASRDRSHERHRRREERELRLAARRSRSRERQRSRSSERYRKRWSRSPVGRRTSPRRHSRSRSRSLDRRARKRSPFINELARTFRNEGLIPGGPSNFLPGIPPLMGQGFPHDQPSPVTPAPMPSFMHHPGPPGPSQMHMQQDGPPFVNYESRPPIGPLMNFETSRGPLIPVHQTDYTAGPIMYNQGNPPRPMQPPILGPPNHAMPMQSPQPVPAPVLSDHPSMNFNQPRCVVNIPPNTPQQQHNDPINRRGNSPRINFNKEAKSTTSISHNGAHPHRPERLKTPEPPIISNSKPFEKTSLSSLLEASVSAKDSLSLPVLYPGFKPEILRHCELALRDLPAEDLRLKMKGRFFFDPYKEDPHPEPEDLSSNSILLRTGRNKIYWEEAEKMDKVQSAPQPKPVVEMHQKSCQTNETETESRGIQVVIFPATADFSMQVSTYDLQHASKEEKRPIMDRLDWNVRETFDYTPKIREADDLRWSLSNSSQKRPWNRTVSPPRIIEEEREISPGRLSTSDHGSRGINVGSSTRSQDNYSFHRSSSREHYSRERYSPTYRRSLERNLEFPESRSDHSRGESPMVLEDSPDEIEIVGEQLYSRGSDWRPRDKSTYRPTSALHKTRVVRGKPAGRPYTSRGGFRGKF